MVNNKDHYKFNSEIHNNSARQNCNVYQALSNLTTYKTFTYYYFGIKGFNKLPSHIKILSQSVKHIKSALKNYLHLN